MPFSLISSVIASRSISHPGRCISDNLIPQHSGRSFGHTVTIKVSPCSNLAAKACLLLLLFYWAFYKGTCMVSLELLRCDTPHDMLGFNIYLVLLTSVMTVLMIIRLHVTLVKFCSATLAFLLPCISVECFSTLALVRDFWAYLCKMVLSLLRKYTTGSINCLWWSHPKMAGAALVLDRFHSSSCFKFILVINTSHSAT